MFLEACPLEWVRNRLQTLKLAISCGAKQKIWRVGLLGLTASGAGGSDVIEGDGTTAEEDKGECEGGEGEGEFVSVVTRQSVVEVHLGDSDGEIDADGKSSDPGKQAEQDEQAAKELGKGRKIGGPGWEPEAGDEVGVVVESSENLVGAVDNHDGTESETHDKEREGLQAIEVAHVVPPGGKKVDYSSSRFNGSEPNARLLCRKGRDTSRGSLSMTINAGANRMIAQAANFW
jgi:hypothetical protein